MATFKVTDADFDTQVLSSKLPVFVDFWATWCGPCKLAGPVIEELSEEYKDQMSFAKLDVDENPMQSQKYGIMSIPTVIVFKDGKEIARQSGFAGKDNFVELIKKGVSS